MLDGDLQDPPELIKDFADKWLEGYDVVYGSRVKRETSKFMNISYKFFYRIFNKLSYILILIENMYVNKIDELIDKNLF